MQNPPGHGFFKSTQPRRDGWFLRAAPIIHRAKLPEPITRPTGSIQSDVRKPTKKTTAPAMAMPSSCRAGATLLLYVGADSQAGPSQNRVTKFDTPGGSRPAPAAGAGPGGCEVKRDPQLRQNASVGSIGRPHLGQNILASLASAYSILLETRQSYRRSVARMGAWQAAAVLPYRRARSAIILRNSLATGDPESACSLSIFKPKRAVSSSSLRGTSSPCLPKGDE